jgi:tRNA (uracil-5-)-methyltransferase
VHNVASVEQNCGKASLINDKPFETTSYNSLEQGKACQDGSSSPKNNVIAANACQLPANNVFDRFMKSTMSL